MIQVVLVKRKNPSNPDADPRWYAETKSAGNCTFDQLCSDASHFSTITPGDVKLAVDSFIYLALRELSLGRTVSLGALGSLRMTVKNVSKFWNPNTGTWETAAPKKREEFVTQRNIECSCVRFNPGPSLKLMCENARYRIVDGGTPKTGTLASNDEVFTIELEEGPEGSED